MKGVRTKRAWGLRIAAAAWLTVSSAHAQSGSEQTDAAREVGAAAQAFQEGQKAQLAGDFTRAAQMFELADQIARTPEALRSAIRNRDAADHPARAATLALAALERYPTDLEASALAQQVIERVGPELSRVTIACDLPCTLHIDGEAVAVERLVRADVFVPPGAHQLTALFDGEREVVEALELIAGTHEQRELRAPVRIERIEPVASEPAPLAREVIARPWPVRATEPQGLSPWYFAGAGALTLASATAATVFGFAALRERDAYEADPTRERYEAGVESQKWTNALWLATGGLAATSIVLLAFTDWDGEQQRSTAAISLSPFAANLVVRSSLP
jgi:hypothetical protein